MCPPVAGLPVPGDPEYTSLVEDNCPKCGTPKGVAPSCARCGLVFARFDAAALAISAPAELEALWRHAGEAWGDRARHALFTERSLAAGAAAYAAAKYRGRGPEDTVAVEQLARITARLEQELALGSASGGSRGRPGPSRGQRLVVLLAAILLVAAGALGLALVWR